MRQLVWIAASVQVLKYPLVGGSTTNVECEHPWASLNERVLECLLEVFALRADDGFLNR